MVDRSGNIMTKTPLKKAIVMQRNSVYTRFERQISKGEIGLNLKTSGRHRLGIVHTDTIAGRGVELKIRIVCRVVHDFSNTWHLLSVAFLFSPGVRLVSKQRYVGRKRTNNGREARIKKKLLNVKSGCSKHNFDDASKGPFIVHFAMGWGRGGSCANCMTPQLTSFSHITPPQKNFFGTTLTSKISYTSYFSSFQNLRILLDPPFFLAFLGKLRQQLFLPCPFPPPPPPTRIIVIEVCSQGDGRKQKGLATELPHHFKRITGQKNEVL